MERTPLIASNLDRYVKNATEEVRRGFVRKVYGILTVQLLLTTAVAIPFQFASKDWIIHTQWLMFLAVALMFFMMFAIITCCHAAVETYPTNYIVLFLLTTFKGVVVGVLSARLTWQTVLLAAGITVAVFLAFTVLAWTTKMGYSGICPYIFGVLTTFAIFGLVIGILSSCGIHVKWMYMLYDCLGVLVFTTYIVFDTQRILGKWGGHHTEFSIDDYAGAALLLYFDIIHVFLHLLRLLGNLLGDRK